MLYKPQDYQKPARLQGSFVSDKEVSDVVAYLKDHYARTLMIRISKNGFTP